MGEREKLWWKMIQNLILEEIFWCPNPNNCSATPWTRKKYIDASPSVRE
jgi:hypothetical protein